MGALIFFFGHFVINEVVGKIDPVKTDGKIIDTLEIFVLAIVAYKKILCEIH